MCVCVSVPERVCVYCDACDYVSELQEINEYHSAVTFPVATYSFFFVLKTQSFSRF